MKPNIIITLVICSLVSLFPLTAFAGDAVKETEIRVAGNCNMCKTRIEKSMKIPEVKFSKWDKKSKMLKITYLPEKITLDSLQHRLASVGHDTETHKAADAVYETLPACCLYRSGDNTH